MSFTPGAGTSYLLSSTAPVPSGTANGVLYLNGSKVVTSGSALVFDGTNLGLGVTPSAWATNSRALQLKSYSAVFEDVVGRTTIGFNAYESASNVFTRIQTEASSLYRQVSGSHSWLTASSGAAGTTISFTQAMTLDASGRLMVGTTTAIGTITSSGPIAIAGSPAGLGGPNRYIGAGGTTDTWYLNVPNSGGYQFAKNEVAQVQFTPAGDFVFGSGAIATNATSGFLYVAGCAGTPTGTPAAYTGRVPIVVDTTNNKLYFYSGGAWRDAGP